MFESIGDPRYDIVVRLIAKIMVQNLFDKAKRYESIISEPLINLLEMEHIGFYLTIKLQD